MRDDPLLEAHRGGNPPAPAPGTQWESAFDAPTGAHSEKPEEFYRLLEEYFPSLPKIELNATKARTGWDRWGAEAPLDLEANSLAGPNAERGSIEGGAVARGISEKARPPSPQLNENAQ